MLKENFLWGGAIAAAQCEGGWKESGKEESIMDHYDSQNRVRHVMEHLDDQHWFPKGRMPEVSLTANNQ